MSSLILRRKAGIHEFTDEFVRSAPVQEMMKKVSTIRDMDIEARGFDSGCIRGECPGPYERGLEL